MVPSSPPQIYRCFRTNVLTISPAALQTPLPRRNCHTTTTTAAEIPVAADKLSPPPEILRINIDAVDPSPLLRLHICHRGYIAVAAPLPLSFCSPSCNFCRRTATTIQIPLTPLQSLLPPTNYHHPRIPAA